MGTEAVSSAVVVPQSQGTGTPSNDDAISAAAQAILASHEQGAYVKEGLGFANIDTGADQVDVTKGVCYVMDTSTSTASERTGAGDPSLKSTKASGFDTELPADQPYAVIIPDGTIDLQLDADSENAVYVTVDVESQNSVTLVGTSGAAPADPYLKLGTVNTSDGSTTRAADHPDPTFGDVTADSATVAGETQTGSLSTETTLRGDRHEISLLDSTSSGSRDTGFSYTFNVSEAYDEFQLSVALFAGSDPGGSVTLQLSGYTNSEYYFTTKSRSTESENDQMTGFEVVNGRICFGTVTIGDADRAAGTEPPVGTNYAVVDGDLSTNREASHLVEGDIDSGVPTPISSISLDSGSDNFAGRAAVYGINYE